LNNPEKEYEIPLHRAAGSAVSAKLETRGQGFGDEPEDQVFSLELRFEGRVLTATSPDDFFAALAALRTQLEAEGLLLACFGCSRNVYPSPMDRDSASARAYRLTLGRQAVEKDRVPLFASGPGIEPATMAEQQAFRDEWFRSLGSFGSKQ
jgi:hypothetical protein